MRGREFAVPDTILVVTSPNKTICAPGSFNSDAKHPGECISCFCFGVATRCKSADLFTYQVGLSLSLMNFGYLSYNRTQQKLLICQLKVNYFLQLPPPIESTELSTVRVDPYSKTVEILTGPTYNLPSVRPLGRNGFQVSLLSSTFTTKKHKTIGLLILF